MTQISLINLCEKEKAKAKAKMILYTLHQNGAKFGATFDEICTKIWCILMKWYIHWR